MVYLFVSLNLVTSIFLNSFFTFNTIDDDRLKAKVNIRGFYSDNNDINNSSFNGYLYLIELVLQNKSKSEIQFYANSCSCSSYIVSNNINVINMANNCSGNFPIIIKLKPNQQFICPVILKTKITVNSPTKIGFILLDPNHNDPAKLFEILGEERISLKNVIWSEPFKIGMGNEKPFEIR